MIPVKYKKLEEYLKEISLLNGINGLLSWDLETMMKSGSADARNKQKSILSAVVYDKSISKDLGDLIVELSSSDLSCLPSDYERANVRDALRNYNIMKRKTKDMITRESELEGIGHHKWISARENSSFETFSPVLKNFVDLKTEIARATHPDLSTYDANIDYFERGMTSLRLTEIFNTAKVDIVPLLQQVLQSKTRSEYIVPQPFKGSSQWDVEKQKIMCAEFAKAIGFDFNKGRLDVSVHPFTGGSHPTDVRITTRYSEDNWLEGISGTIHEVGHGLYEQGRSEEFSDLPVSEALSMGIHESQSLFWERYIFQSKEFWEYATPIVHTHFPHTLSQSADDFYKYVNQVEQGFIRIESDELTYPLHIFLRFELEKGLFDGSISIDNLPTIWNAKMKEYLNIDVPSDSKGVLQDVHWSAGLFGYFPSYTLGSMIAAQLFETAKKEIPDLKEKIRKGEFTILREWLRVKIHSVGSLYPSPDELLIQVTGKPLDSSIYANYLREKYSDLYNL